jgi:hypothetical protein
VRACDEVGDVGACALITLVSHDEQSVASATPSDRRGSNQSPYHSQRRDGARVGVRAQCLHLVLVSQAPWGEVEQVCGRCLPIMAEA